MNIYPQAQACSANTHVVENTSHALENYNLFSQDLALKEAVIREGAEWAVSELENFGQLCGSGDRILWGMQANQNKPVLHTHDRFGHRIDQIEYHPAYHKLMQSSVKQGLHGSPWINPRPGAHVARAAASYLQTQVDAGHGCPITMTFASFPTLQKQPDIAKDWLPKILSDQYDPGNIPWYEKNGLTIGMAMTEKQGGSDVRSNSTRAIPISKKGSGKAYELVGHKYFVSAPMCDAFLVLAQADGGISCFLVPRWRPDGSKNPFQILRLKDKMGNVSNASSETELRGAYGWLIGDEGRGVANILEMVSLTRFDCMVASAGMMRQAVSQITHHCHYRAAFGKKLDQQPLMQNVLTDLTLEAEASVAMSMRVARRLDEAGSNEQAQHFVRLATAIGKYWICKRSPAHAYEAMECIGGSGVMENSIMPRLYREAPINTIWEGSGNVQCLDVLRAMNKAPGSVDAYLAELESSQDQNMLFDNYLLKLKKALSDKKDLEYNARSLVEKMALALQASCLIQSGDPVVSDAFCQARLGKQSGLVYGMLPGGIDCHKIIERARPDLD